MTLLQNYNLSNDTYIAKMLLENLALLKFPKGKIRWTQNIKNGYFWLCYSKNKRGYIWDTV